MHKSEKNIPTKTLMDYTPKSSPPRMVRNQARILSTAHATNTLSRKPNAEEAQVESSIRLLLRQGIARFRKKIID